jgi:hypothetical protein
MQANSLRIVSGRSGSWIQYRSLISNITSYSVLRCTPGLTMVSWATSSDLLEPCVDRCISLVLLYCKQDLISVTGATVTGYPTRGRCNLNWRPSKLSLVRSDTVDVLRKAEKPTADRVPKSTLETDDIWGCCHEQRSSVKRYSEANVVVSMKNPICLSRSACCNAVLGFYMYARVAYL